MSGVLALALGRKGRNPNGKELILCVLTTACFESQLVAPQIQIDSGVPSRLLIDDFEDGDVLPRSNEFDRWQCARVNDTGDQWQLLNCGITPLGEGSASNHAYFIEYSITEEQNRDLLHPAILLMSNMSVPIDASRYRNFVFDVRVVPGNLPLPTKAEFRVYLTCLNVNPSSEIDYSYEIGRGVTPTPEWQTHVLPIIDFFQFEWDSSKTPIDKRTCSVAVDGVKFELQSNLPSGAATDGTVMIDNVYME